MVEITRSIGVDKNDPLGFAKLFFFRAASSPGRFSELLDYFLSGSSIGLDDAGVCDFAWTRDYDVPHFSGARFTYMPEDEPQYNSLDQFRQILDETLEGLKKEFPDQKEFPAIRKKIQDLDVYLRKRDEDERLNPSPGS